MKRDYKLLLIGNLDSIFMRQLVMSLKKNNPDSHIYFWGINQNLAKYDDVLFNCFDEYRSCILQKHHQIPIIRKIDSFLSLRKQFKSFVEGKRFDYINVHFIKREYFFLLDLLKGSSTKLLLTPWGSDVYRMKKYDKFLMKRLFAAADYVTGNGDRFSNDVKRILNVPQSKIVPGVLGADIMDYIVANKSIITSDEAKKELGVEGSFIITCGYNAHEEQCHIQMIDSIKEVENQLPANLLLFFPLTYPSAPEYKNLIRNKVKGSGLSAVFFEDYLTVPRFFLMIQASDMFIHVQTTDADSSSLREYLLCEKKVINGQWLKYPDLEINNVKPYYEVSNIDSLGDVIIDAFKSKTSLVSKEVCRIIERRQWKVAVKDWDGLFSRL